MTGTVTTEIKTEGSGQELQGRISYENRGECFFLPYNKDDVEGNVTLRSGDKVSFQIAANQRYKIVQKRKNNIEKNELTFYLKKKKELK